MKYAREVIDLMAAFPGRDFRMAQIVRHVGRGVPESVVERERLRKGVRRVLEALADQGLVERDAPPLCRGAAAAYRWRKVGHQPVA